MRKNAVVAASACAVTMAAAPLGGGGAVAQTTDVVDVNVSFAGCILARGGHRTVPAGSRIIVTGGWRSGTSGAVESFRQAQTSVLSVNDGRMIDVSDALPAPTELPDGTWLSLFRYPTGVVLAAPGDSMRFTFTLFFERKVEQRRRFRRRRTQRPDTVRRRPVVRRHVHCDGRLSREPRRGDADRARARDVSRARALSLVAFCPPETTVRLRRLSAPDGQGADAPHAGFSSPWR